MYNHFFEGKRILVSGVAGVKASWLTLALLEAGAEVTGVDIKAPDLDSNFVASGLGKRIRFIQGDVADLGLMRSLVENAEGIFHLAAIALVGEARRNPYETYRTNTFGVATVLEAIRLSEKPKRAVFITTDKVYSPKKNGELWSEADPLGASGPYPVSKSCAEFILADYYRSYLSTAGHLIGIGRAGNVVIGGDMYSSQKTNGAGRIFVDCFMALADNKAPEIFSPGFTRPYTYGLDIISGYMSLMSRLDQNGISGEAFNFGPYELYGVSNALLATKICDLWGGKIRWKRGTAREEPFEYQSLSLEKSRRLLQWQPAFTLYETLQATTRWYQKWVEERANAIEGYMYDFNRQQLIEHRNAASNLGVDWAS